MSVTSSANSNNNNSNSNNYNNSYMNNKALLHASSRASQPTATRLEAATSRYFAYFLIAHQQPQHQLQHQLQLQLELQHHRRHQHQPSTVHPPLALVRSLAYLLLPLPNPFCVLSPQKFNEVAPSTSLFSIDSTTNTTNTTSTSSSNISKCNNKQQQQQQQQP
ncbi:hypothetical protein AWZ03_012062 [Drosophila navojoa]|uniref:Uncharacterized protein n=1 Tax=Drosophila navojoa TaxID=7232 RepID=A0A484AYL2_DRONA|nr:hypothetical protein AWZ03_012062 [Drosophila navojoa]